MSFFKPKVPTTASAAAPAPELVAKRLKTEDRQTDRTAAKARRKGRNRLRIDLQAGNAGSDGTGINVPNA